MTDTFVRLRDARRALLDYFLSRNDSENGSISPMLGRDSDLEFNRVVYAERAGNRAFDVRWGPDEPSAPTNFCIFKMGGENLDVFELSVEIGDEKMDFGALWDLRSRWLIAFDDWKAVEAHAERMGYH